MSLDPNVLPTELLTVPQPLIGFTGLDIANNSIHKSIWEAFSNNRKTDRALIQFKLLNQNYDFPVSKPKRTSFEWYHPRGILKRNWMLKHLHVLPSVVVLFQDIEWNDPQWSEKQMQCASLVQSLKNSLQGRNTKLAIVLLQSNASLPPGEDLLATDRAANLTSNCDINSKMLFVLPYNDHLSGYTLRLESALVELAQSYYAQMAKQVRLHRDQLTPSHQSLRIRHQFKLGFIAEMRLDFNTALKHFAQGYQNLDEIRIVDTNCLEIKTVAGYLNYKICRLMFKLNAPRDAINQFKTHIDRYKGRPGFKELLFEHYAWLSVQYSAFAELFCEAIKNGLPALQTQHPGIYYHKASEYIGRRKEAFLQCSSLSLSPQEPIPPQIANVLYSEFYGIRGTKTSEPVSEQQIIAIVQENEKQFSHSAATITLLGQAMAQFKVYKCLRFRKKLAIDMAEEYLRSGDHSNALTLYSLMLSDYRTDQWYTIFTEVLLKTLRSAFLSASVTDFVCCSIEAMSPKINIDVKERIVVLENLWKVFQGVAPLSHTQIAPELKSVWDSKLSSFKSPVYIDLDNISEIIECVVTFEKSQLKHEEQIRLEVYMRSKSAVPLKLNNISVLLTDGKSNYMLDVCQCKIIEVEAVMGVTKGAHEDDSSAWMNFDSNFLLESDKCYKFAIIGGQFHFKENTELQIVRLEIKMGTDNISAILTQSNALNRTKEFRCFNPVLDCMQHIPVSSACYITPTFHLTVQNDFENQPMIVNEYFRVTCSLSNPFDLALQNVRLTISVSNALRKNVFLVSDLTGDRQKLQSQIQIDVGELMCEATTAITYYVTSLIEGNIELTQKISYQTVSNENDVGLSSNIVSLSVVDSPTSAITSAVSSLKLRPQQSHNIIVETVDGILCKSKEDTLIIPCTDDFKLTAGFHSLNRDPLAFAYKDEEILLRINMEVRTRCPIEILEAEFVSDVNISEKASHKKRLKLPVLCHFGKQIEDVRLLHVNACTANEWITKERASGNRLDFKQFRKLTQSDSSDRILSPKDDAFNKNLLNKIPINSTIVRTGDLDVGRTHSTSTLSLSVTDDLKDGKDEHIKIPATSKTIYNCTEHAFKSSPRLLKGRIREVKDQTHVERNFGVYFVRWRRAGSLHQCESKFAIHGMDVVPAPVNLYCYLEERMYVKVPMSLRVTIKNPSHKILHLVANLKNSDNFMFAGHKQINISIFSKSEFVVVVNLYPLKAGWQTLPELTLEYSDEDSDVDLSQSQPQQRQQELYNLVKRWMPKRVFVLPPFLE